MRIFYTFFFLHFLQFLSISPFFFQLERIVLVTFLPVDHEEYEKQFAKYAKAKKEELLEAGTSGESSQ